MASALGRPEGLGPVLCYGLPSATGSRATNTGSTGNQRVLQNRRTRTYCVYSGVRTNQCGHSDYRAARRAPRPYWTELRLHQSDYAAHVPNLRRR